MFVKSDEEYEVEDILEKQMISEKPTTSSSKRNMTPLRTHENPQKPQNCVRTLQCFEEKGDKVRLSKVV
jgi:hypothetical protein